MGRRVEQRTQDARPRDLELVSEIVLRASPLLRNRVQGQEDCAVSQVRATHDVLDAV
jgi:hypothetical protein